MATGASLCESSGIKDTSQSRVDPPAAIEEAPVQCGLAYDEDGALTGGREEGPGSGWLVLYELGATAGPRPRGWEAMPSLSSFGAAPTRPRSTL